MTTRSQKVGKVTVDGLTVSDWSAVHSSRVATRLREMHDHAGVRWVTVREVVVARRLLGLERVMTFPMEVAKSVPCPVCMAEVGVMCRFMPLMFKEQEPGLLVHDSRREAAFKKVNP